MRALTLWQPWAWAILHAGKRIENRSWCPPSGMIDEVIALHAGKRYARDAWNWPLISPPPKKSECTLGAVVGVARVVAVVDVHGVPLGQDPWWAGPLGWILDDVHPLVEPVPCRGFQGLWSLPPVVEDAVRARMVVTCPHCENEIEPDTCHCGESRENHRDLQDEHPFVPMGCDCLRA
jgi:hypothetical protein